MIPDHRAEQRAAVLVAQAAFNHALRSYTDAAIARQPPRVVRRRAEVARLAGAQLDAALTTLLTSLRAEARTPAGDAEIERTIRLQVILSREVAVLPGA